MARSALLIGKLRPNRMRVSRCDARFYEFQLRVGLGNLTNQPTLKSECRRVIRFLTPVFRIGLKVRCVIKVKSWMSCSDYVVVHVAVRTADMTQRTGFRPNQFRSRIDHSELVDRNLYTPGTLVMRIPPSRSRTVTGFASDTLGNCRRDSVAGQFGRGVVAS